MEVGGKKYEKEREIKSQKNEWRAQKGAASVIIQYTAKGQADRTTVNEG